MNLNTIRPDRRKNTKVSEGPLTHRSTKTSLAGGFSSDEAVRSEAQFVRIAIDMPNERAAS